MPPEQPATKVALCMTCMGRRDHIEQTLTANLQANAGFFPQVVFVLLDYNSADGLGDYIKANHAAEITNGRLVYYRHEGPKNFRMAHAKNMAHRLGIREGADILVNLDADNWTGNGFARYVAARFEEAIADGDIPFMRARENHCGPGPGTGNRMPWGCGGRIAVTRSAFLNAGGYDEFYQHWAPDDKDFAARLARMGYTRLSIRGENMGSVGHGNDLRFVSDEPGAPKKMTDTAHIFKLEGRENITVVNNGHFGVGTVFRNFDKSRPIILPPLPTRIFGIGLHKTATTSLAKALTLLGYDSAHWESAQWAKHIWLEMRATGHSKTLEAHYALSDFPIPALYEALDKGYPGAKFILTMRDEAKWLDSLERHWRRFQTQFWDFDGFSNQMHAAFYGGEDFNPKRMLNCYRQHNADVLEYFKNRPHDLLIMHMDDGAGWPALAGFLGHPVPNIPYPREFVTDPGTGEQSYPSCND